MKWKVLAEKSHAACSFERICESAEYRTFVATRWQFVFLIRAEKGEERQRNLSDRRQRNAGVSSLCSLSVSYCSLLAFSLHSYVIVVIISRAVYQRWKYNKKQQQLLSGTEKCVRYSASDECFGRVF